jgi:hypothetical protein
VTRPARQHPDFLPPDVLRLVEGIALTLAAEHHAAEIAARGLPNAERVRLDEGSVAHLASP